MLKKLSEKLRAKFPATTPGCSIVKTARLDDASLEVFKPKASPVGGQSQQLKEKEWRKKEFKNRNVAFSRNLDLGACPSQNRDASGKNGKLPCCKCIFDQVQANLAEIQPENRQNVHIQFFAPEP